MDTSFYPADILKYLSVSDICFNFWSTVVAECVPMDVFNVCITPDIDDIFVKNHRMSSNYSIFKHVLGTCPDLFKSEGVTHMMSIKEIISDLPRMSLDDFKINPANQKIWVKKFLTSVDGNCSKRILDEIGC